MISAETLNSFTTIAGAVLTLMIFSYLLGDNFLYRIAIHVFIGAAAAFVLITALESVVIPWINLTILATPPDVGRLVLGLVPFAVGLLLLFKAALGLVLVLAVGVALALWGAITGTLIPLAAQTARGFRPENLIEGLIVVIGTVSVLLYFTYLGTRRPNAEPEQAPIFRLPGLVGQAFLVVTLGATYALLIISALTILTGVIAQRLLILKPG